MIRALFVAVLFCVYSSAALANPAAVCQIGGCSGVCIHPAGLVMTADHCAEPIMVVQFDGRPPMSARLIYTGQNDDGPSVFKIDPPPQSPLTAAPIANGPPPAGATVYTWGYPASAGALFRAEGEIQGGGVFPVFDPSKNRVLRIKGNHTGPELQTAPGWSGGPLFYEGDLVGILSGGSPTAGSTWISWADTAAAYRATVENQPPPMADQRPELRIYSKKLCIPCGAFWDDYKTDPAFRAVLDRNFKIRKIDPDEDPQQAAADQAAGSLPVFIAEGVRVIGYETLNPNRKQILTKALGITSGPPTPIPDTPPAPVPDESAIDWEAVQVVLLVEEKPLGKLSGLLVGLVEGRAVGPVRRAVNNASNGKADLVPVFQRTEPLRFQAVEAAAGVDVQTVHVLALVKRQDLGILRGLIAKRLERALAERLDFSPVVEVITERGHAADFQAITAAMDTEPVEPWQPETPPEPPAQTTPEASGIVDKLAAALEVAEKLRNPPPTNDTPKDPELPWQPITAGGVAFMVARQLAKSARAWWHDRKGGDP